MSELKKCPFCGGSNIYVDGYDHDAGKRWRVVCLDCMATVDDGCIQQKYRAIEAWNRRADHLPDATKMVSNADRIRSMSIGEAMNCPKCNSANIYTPAENLFICNRCGHEWQAGTKKRADFCPMCGRKLERSDT